MPTPPGFVAAADLSVCDLEPIRWPGAVQPSGRMLVLDGATRQVVAWSAGFAAGDRAAVLAALDATVLATLVPGEGPAAIGSVVPLGGHAMQLSAHHSGPHVIVECEPHLREPDAPAPIYALARSFLPRLQSAATLEALLQMAVDELRSLTGFGRSLVYRFDEEGHGEVLAESLALGYDSYLGHHFPASDVPRQARELYLVSRFRLIADAHYVPVPLVTSEGAPAGGIDLSLAVLRSVAPVHLEYMRNMGTLASMSVSIVVDGRLWGLISCHHHAPRGLAPSARAACEHLGQLLALQIGAKESHAEVAERLELRQLTLAMVADLADSDASLQQLVHLPELLRLARASGAAVVRDEQVWSVGDVLAQAETLQLAHWIASLDQDVYASQQLAEHYAPAQAFAERVAGVLAVSISRVHRHVILWFRPPVLRTMRWAGNPHKAVDEAGRIQPRQSFASWVERIGGRAPGWRNAELAAARELRQALIGIVLRRAEEMAEVATELGRVNRELEAFSYTVSHDLRAPMRHIAGYVDLVRDLEGRQISERGHRYLGHVKDAAAFAGHLVDALLDFSRMGRAALKPRTVDTSALLADLVRELMRAEPKRQVQWTLAPDLPALHADPFLLQVAMRNLLANALKYTRERPDARIDVRGVRDGRGHGIEVQDNGVGFEMQYQAKLFGVFQRLHTTEEFEGTGIGLAIVKRIVERHGGQVWAWGQPGAGARFGFALPSAAGADLTPSE